MEQRDVVSLLVMMLFTILGIVVILLIVRWFKLDEPKMVHRGGEVDRSSKIEETVVLLLKRKNLLSVATGGEETHTGDPALELTNPRVEATVGLD